MTSDNIVLIIGGVLTCLTALLNYLKTTSVQTDVKDVQKKVNGQLTDALNKVDQLHQEAVQLAVNTPPPNPPTDKAS